LQVVLAVVDLLHDVFFALDTRLDLPIKLVLQAIKGVLRLVDLLIRLSHTILDFLRDSVLKSIKALLSISELCAIVLAHSVDFGLEFLP